MQTFILGRRKSISLHRVMEPQGWGGGLINHSLIVLVSRVFKKLQNVNLFREAVGHLSDLYWVEGQIKIKGKW